MKMKATKVFMVKQEEIELFKASDPFIGCRPVPGIMAMHVMSVMNGKVSLWKNALFFLNDHASLQITYSNSSPRAENVDAQVNPDIIVGDSVLVVKGLDIMLWSPIQVMGMK